LRALPGFETPQQSREFPVKSAGYERDGFAKDLAMGLPVEVQIFLLRGAEAKPFYLRSELPITSLCAFCTCPRHARKPSLLSDFNKTLPNRRIVKIGCHGASPFRGIVAACFAEEHFKNSVNSQEVINDLCYFVVS
jgi:hypothetical protein